MRKSLKFSGCFAAFLVAASVVNFAQGVAPVNPRESSQTATSRRSTALTGTTNTDAARRAGAARATQTRATSGRSRVAVASGERAGMTGRTRMAVRPARPVGVVVSRATRLNKMKTSPARTAGGAGLSNGKARAGMARATAVFNDVSKIGGGYAACRDSYSTCMDQLCANANETYRRCFCSDRFTGFRETEEALDQAMLLLRKFEDNNLNAVDKTAAEVNAMYSATVGEQAIKNDTSGAAKLLDSISDLLSGKTKRVEAPKSNTGTSLGVLDFSSDLGDVWGGDGNDIFASSSRDNGPDLSTMSGAELFKAAQNQCVQLTKGQCENDAVFNMTKSSYGILISQDCNLYEKTLDKKKQTLTDAVRNAEKILREARLDEYRSHNSTSVNECIAKVREGMLNDAACGEDFKRCLDPTGAYVNPQTGEAIYSPRLFQLEYTIKMDTGTVDSGVLGADIISQNTEFVKVLDGYRRRVEKELDSCRDDADYVWNEFKRSALIEIAQAQGRLIEGVKMSCVSTIAQCYDTQTGALNEFDTSNAKKSGALGRYAAKGMCREQVVACASLFATGTEKKDCKFDDRGHLTSNDDADRCGLTALLAYVDNVDNTVIAESCESGMKNYIEELCTPTSTESSSDSTSGDGEDDDEEAAATSSVVLGYPWKCRFMKFEDLSKRLNEFAETNCGDPTTNQKKLQSETQEKLDNLLASVKEDMQYLMQEKCVEMDGFWYNNTSQAHKVNGKPEYLTKFYNTLFARGKGADYSSWGACVENNIRTACLAYNSDTKKVATYNESEEKCEFTEEWFQERCAFLNGRYDNGSCFVQQD